MLSSRQSLKFVVTAITLVATTMLLAAAGAEEATISELKARDVERELSYAAVASPPHATGGGQAVGVCLPADDDDDGMGDLWESGQGLDPANPDDAWLDPDSDHVVNLFEFQLGSDPHSAATPPTVTVAPAGGDFTDVGSAIDTVAPGTAIRVVGGIHLLNYITFQERVVMIQGGWSPDFTQRDLHLFPTTFDGQFLAEVLYFSNSSGNPVIVLDGIHFVRGDGSFGALNLLAQGTACMTSVVNCSITDSTSVFYGGSYHMNNWDSSQADRTIANTLFVGNDCSGIYSQIVNSAFAHWRILHTSISGNVSNGSNGEGIDALSFIDGLMTTHLYNSVVWGNDVGRNDIEIHGNITIDADHADIGTVGTLGGAVVNEGEGVVDVDPLFVDPAGGDYHLQEASPVIDAGTPLGIPLTDFEGDPRNAGAAPDMGGDEFQPQVTVVALDIKPGSCPNSFYRNSNGFLPVALVGTGEFDVNEVDLDTVFLSREGVGGAVTPNEGPPGPHTVVEDVTTPFDGSPLQITDEFQVFGIDGLIVLNQSNIVASSIVVTDVTGIITYGEGADYTVQTFPDRTELCRVLGGAIGVNQPLLIDYQIGPEPCGCHELEDDGITDLSMKFNSNDVMEALELDSVECEFVELEVSGTLLDGTEFTARDCIRLVPPGDIDSDCAVGVADFLILLATWGPCPAPPAYCDADFDESSDVGVIDFLMLLANWG